MCWMSDRVRGLKTPKFPKKIENVSKTLNQRTKKITQRIIKT